MILNNVNPNYPTPPRKISNDYMSFPNDLIVDKRAFYCQINFVKYDVVMQYTSSAIPTIPVGGMNLPIPKKLNDIQTLTWSEYSLKDQGEASSKVLSAASQIAGKVGIIRGESINPLLFMQFQRPNYKEFVLSWSFTPNNEQESRTIRRIIEMFKYRSLPRQKAGGIILDYPDIALLKLHPDDSFTFKFRPCAVMSVSVDYTGAGMPSFFKNGAPTTVNLNVQLKEIQLWDKTNYDGGSGVTPSDLLEDLGVDATKTVDYLKNTTLGQAAQDAYNSIINRF